MKTSIIIGQESNSEVFSKSKKDRFFYNAKTEQEAYLYHIEHPEVDSYIIYSELFTIKELQSLIQHIHYLNATIEIFICHTGKLNNSILLTNKNIHLTEKEEEISEILLHQKKVKRESNRIEWPVTAKFSETSKTESKHFGNILSISSNGCFIRTETILEVNNIISLTIFFKDFNFLTEGTIERITKKEKHQHYGMAIKFHKTSPQTKNYIQSIINEKILLELMKKLEPIQGKKINE